MAWTTPRTWVTSEVPTAAIFNAHVRDNLNALYGTPTTYTPQIDQGASTNIAKTTDRAYYVQVGRICHAWVTLSVTGTGSAGSSITITLPITASTVTTPDHIGVGLFYDASTTTRWEGAAELTSTTQVAISTSGTYTGLVGNGPSVALANGDKLRFQLTYPVA